MLVSPCLSHNSSLMLLLLLLLLLLLECPRHVTRMTSPTTWVEISTRMTIRAARACGPLRTHHLTLETWRSGLGATVLQHALNDSKTAHFGASKPAGRGARHEHGIFLHSKSGFYAIGLSSKSRSVVPPHSPSAIRRTPVSRVVDGFCAGLSARQCLPSAGRRGREERQYWEDIADDVWRPEYADDGVTEDGLDTAIQQYVQK
jgi:hypothetical protein